MAQVVPHKQIHVARHYNSPTASLQAIQRRADSINSAIYLASSQINYRLCHSSLQPVAHCFLTGPASGRICTHILIGTISFWNVMSLIDRKFTGSHGRGSHLYSLVVYRNPGLSAVDIYVHIKLLLGIACIPPLFCSNLPSKFKS